MCVQLNDQNDKITDCYISLRVYTAEDITIEELEKIAGFKPTRIGVKGTKHTPRSPPLKYNFVFLDTEKLSKSKCLDNHIAELKKRLPDGRFIDRFDLSKFTVMVTVYWWTTEVIYFRLTPESLETLQNIGVTIDFNYAIYADDIEED